MYSIGRPLCDVLPMAVSQEQRLADVFSLLRLPSCDDTQDVGPLEILRTYDSAQVSGCPILMERLDNPSGF